MIAHVAQADEHRGRVVLWLGAGGDANTAVDAALATRRHTNQNRECSIEDQQAFRSAELPFARETSLSGAQASLA